MREEKILVKILKDLVGLISEEATRNPNFEKRLDDILLNIPVTSAKSKRRVESIKVEEMPNIFEEVRVRSAEDFELWLRDLSIPMLKALIKHHDLDAAKRSQKWKESQKFSKLITEQIYARLNRGSSFLKEDHTN